MSTKRDSAGMTTAEYSVGVVAATGFAGVLYLLIPGFEELVRYLISLIASVLPFASDGLFLPMLP